MDQPKKRNRLIVEADGGQTEDGRWGFFIRITGFDNAEAVLDFATRSHSGVMDEICKAYEGTVKWDRSKVKDWKN